MNRHHGNHGNGRGGGAAGKHTAAPRNVRSEPQMTLHEAVRAKNLSVANRLLQKDSVRNTINRRDDSGITPLISAVKRDDLQMVTVLLEHGASPDKILSSTGATALHYAALWGFYAVAKKLMDYADSLSPRTPAGSTPLHSACRVGNYRIAKELMERGATKTAKNEEGQSPLHLAAGSGSIRIVKVLVEEYDVYAAPRDNNGRTPRDYANGNEHFGTAGWLENRLRQVGKN